MNLYAERPRDHRNVAIRSLLLGLGLMLMFYLGSQLIASLIAAVFLEGPVGYTELLALPSGNVAIRSIQVVTALVAWAAPSLLWAMSRGNIRAYLGFRNRTWTPFFLLGGLLILVAFPLAQWLVISQEWLATVDGLSGLAEWAAASEERSRLIYSSLLSDVSVGAILANVLVIAILPAITEELFFRGVLAGNMSELMSPHLAIWISAFVFSLLHFEMPGFFSRLFLGGILGYLYLYSGSLWVPILGHFLHNGMSLLIYTLSLSGVLSPNILTSEFVIPIGLVLLSVVMTVVLLYLFIQQSNKRNLRLAYE